eukprot:5066980-Amphidinium_carterae.2
MSDGRPVAVWCMDHTELPMMVPASIGQQFMETGSPRMIYEKARFTRLRAFTHTIYWNDPAFPRNLGPLNDVDYLDPDDRNNHWMAFPLDAAGDFR